jgi:uncharacterized protein (DUF362 family)
MVTLDSTGLVHTVTDRRRFLQTVAATFAIGAAATVTRASAASLARRDRSSVAFATGADRRAMMFEVLKPFEQQIRAGMKGKQLVIKPNMVKTTTPLCATHVDALRGLLEFVKPLYSGQIIIAEACSGDGDSFAGFKNYGYLDLQKNFDIKFVNLNLTSGSTFWILDRDLHPDKIQIADMFLDPNNYSISISRLKTHDSVVMTAGTKNMVMAAPLNIPAGEGRQQMNYKNRMHSGGDRWLNYNMFLVARQVRPDFTVIDGVEGMQGNGPVRGLPVDHRIALAGDDVLAVDSLCAMLMGIPIEDVGYLNYCAADGLGIIDRAKIDIIGGKEPEQYVIPYKLHDRIEQQLGWKGAFQPQK